MTTDSKITADELKAISDLLMGAAAADGQFDRAEIEAIVDELCNLAGLDEPDDELKAHLEAFKPTSHDLEQTCARITADTPEKRRMLLRLVARVAEADEIHDLDEEHYLKRAGRFMGAAPEEYANLTLDMEEEGPAEVDEEVIEAADAEPPPVPK